MKTQFSTVILILLINITLIAQNENIKVEISTDTTTSQYDKMLKYFLIEKTEVKHLYKIDLFQLALSRPNMSFETKLTNKSSIEIEGLFAHDINNYNSSRILSNSNDIDYKVFYAFLSTDYKYYYNINRRIKKGKNINGFSANYFSIGLSAHFTFFNDFVYEIDESGFIKYKFYNSSATYLDKRIIQGTLYKHEARESTGFVNFGYGLQRRIGNIGYVASDLKLGIGTNKDFDRLWIMPQISIKAGFAISSFKKR